MTGDKPRQLPLALPHRPATARDDFLVGAANYAAITMIDAWPDWPVRTVYLHGGPGTGKSHLAEIWMRASGADGIAAGALTEADVEPLVARGGVAIENIDAGDVDEAALFHLLNLAGEKKVAVLMTGRSEPAALGLKLADLASRVRAAQPLRLAEPDDLLLKRVLIKLFADRQIEVQPALIDHLVTRLERSFAAANRIVEVLDHAALAEGRAVTRRLADAALIAVAMEREEPGA
jgi:chromosomal replication initiation ATPase DnaA